jgi:hypothetical protein
MTSISSSFAISPVSPVEPVSHTSTLKPPPAPAKAVQTNLPPKKPDAAKTNAVTDDSSNVTLSQSAQVQQLTAEGDNVSQIAGILGMSIASIYSELGVAAPVAPTSSLTETAPVSTSSKAKSPSI